MTWSKDDYKEYGKECLEQGGLLEVYDNFKVNHFDVFYIYIEADIKAIKYKTVVVEMFPDHFNIKLEKMLDIPHQQLEKYGIKNPKKTINLTANYPKTAQNLARFKGKPASCPTRTPNGYVYAFYDKNGLLLYIGKTNNLETRMYQHFVKNGHLPEKCYKNTQTIKYIKFPTISDAEIYEMFLIKKYKPLYNTMLKRGEIPTITIKHNHKWQTRSKESFL